MAVKPPFRWRATITSLSFIALSGVAAILVSCDQWMARIGQFLVVEDAAQQTDAIVPLAGEPTRVLAAAELFDQGASTWFVLTDMYVSGSSSDYSYVDSVVGQATRNGVPKDRILIAPGPFKTTYGEVLGIRQLVREHGWKSIAVVTSPYHCRRAKLMLDELISSEGVNVIVRPVDPHWYIAAQWWTTARGRQTTVSEYAKLGLYVVGYHRLVA